MKKLFLPVIAALTMVLSLSALADGTSAPVPIHRTTAKHRAVKPVKRPAPAQKPTAPAAANAASAAK